MDSKKYIKSVRCLLIITLRIEKEHCLAFFEKAQSYAEQPLSEEAQKFLSRLEQNFEAFITEKKEDLDDQEDWNDWLYTEYPKLINERQAYFQDYPLDLEDYSFIAKKLKLSTWELIPPKLITPKAIKEELATYVFGQEDYLKRLSLCFYNHLLKAYYPHLDLPKSSLLVCGNSGVGKTYAIQTLAKTFSFPVVFINCSNLVQEGIIGESIGSAFARVYRELKGNKKALERAVVVFDEFDKLFEAGYYNERILTEILSVIDDQGSVDMYFYQDKKLELHSQTIRLETKNCFFLFTGVFAPVEQIVKKRLNRSTIGFDKDSQEEFSFYKELKQEDLAAYINRVELLGRISDFIALESIDSKVLEEIVLKSKSSPIQALKDLFSLHGLKLNFSLEAVKELCSYTLKQGLGVRGLKSVLWSLLSKEIYNLNHENTGQSYHIDKDFLRERLA